MGTWDLGFWGLGGKLRVLRTRGRQHAVSITKKHIYIYLFIYRRPQICTLKYPCVILLRPVIPHIAPILCQAGDKKKFVHTGAMTVEQISQFIEVPCPCRGLVWEAIEGSILGVIRGDTRSLDYGSYRGYLGGRKGR